MKSPIVSICLPCYGRVNYVRNTLKSIYEDNNNVSLEDFEVVISDNDPRKEVSCLMKEFKYSNLHYHYTQCEGFMNSYYVLTYAKGLFLKLHNSQVTFKGGVLARMIKEINQNIDKKPLFFYTNGLLNKFMAIKLSNFDDFFFELSYWPSWSNGFSIWKEDFDRLGNISLNKLFPHTSIFISQHQKKYYIVNDSHWFDTQRVKGRCGHNKFYAFTIEFPSIIEECYLKKWISLSTKQHILHDIMTEYLPTLIFNKYVARIENYDSEGFKENIKIYFPPKAYLITMLSVLLVPFRMVYRKVKLLIC